MNQWLSARSARDLAQYLGFLLPYALLTQYARAGLIVSIADPFRPRLRLYHRATLLSALPEIAHQVLQRRCRQEGRRP